MNETQNALTLLVVLLFVVCGAVRLAEAEYRNRAFAELLRRYLELRPAHRLLIGVFVVIMCLQGGSKPTNEQQQASFPLPAAEAEMTLEEAVSALPAAGGSMSLMEGGEPLRLTSNQYAAGFALLPRTSTNTAWLAAPSNAVAHAPWTFYGLAEDTFWLPATNWSFVLGTNAVEGAHVSSSGTLSFDPATPKGSPRATATPDGDTISFLAPLQGSLGTVPPQGRFWHAPTPSNSVLLTWQDVFAGRDTNSPVTVQAELFWNGDFAYRYAFTNAIALTNFVVGAQHNGGGETYALNATNLLANGLELRWRAFGTLDPGVDDHDGDGLTTYDEVMLYGTSPARTDSDFDGLSDALETAPGSATSATDPDTDGDGLADGLDPQPGVWDDPDATNGIDGLTFWYKVQHGLDPAANNALDSDYDGWPDWKELLAGTDTNAYYSTPQNADWSCRLFDVTVTLNADLPAPAVLTVGGHTLALRQAGSYSLTLKEGIAHTVTLRAARPCAASLSATLGSPFAVFQSPGGAFTGGAAVPGGVPVACGVIAQPVVSIAPERVCFHAGHPKTVEAEVAPDLDGAFLWTWYNGGAVSAPQGKVTDISWDGAPGASGVNVRFSAAGASQPRYAYRDVTRCTLDDGAPGGGENTWCDEHEAECWYCGCVPQAAAAAASPGQGEPSYGAGSGDVLPANTDDDDADGQTDVADTDGVAADNDLSPLYPFTPYSGGCCPCPEHNPDMPASASLVSCSAKLGVWADPDKVNEAASAGRGIPVYVEGAGPSTSVGADRLVWEWQEDGDTRSMTNAFTVLSVRLFGDLDFDGGVDADDKALHPALSHEYGWCVPAATNVFRPVRLRTDVGLSGGVYTLALSGPAGMCRIWTTGNPASTNSPLLVCGQTATNGVNGVNFLSGGDSDLYVEAVNGGTAILTYAYTGSGIAAGITCTASMKMTGYRPSVSIANPDSAGWSDLLEKTVILSDQDVRVRISITPALPDLAAALSLFGTALKVMTSETCPSGQELTLTDQNVTLVQMDGSSEMRIALNRTQLVSLGVMPSESQDNIYEKAWMDYGIDDPTMPSNLTDGMVFDTDLAAASRGRCTGVGNLNSSTPNSPMDKSFFMAGGREIITAEFGGAVCQRRQLMNQADVFYFSGHGNHSDGTLEGIGVSDVGNYWQEDLDFVVFSACSVLDINDYNNFYSGADHIASPGKLWEQTGPTYLLGYNYVAPNDLQGTDSVVAYWIANRASLGDVDAWRNANNNSSGRNACAIEKSTGYYYFHRTGIFPFYQYTWTFVPKASW